MILGNPALVMIVEVTTVTVAGVWHLGAKLVWGKVVIVGTPGAAEFGKTWLEQGRWRCLRALGVSGSGVGHGEWVVERGAEVRLGHICVVEEVGFDFTRQDVGER